MRILTTRDSFDLELDRMEEALVAPNAPKVGVSLEDMGMGGNKRTVFYNKNKKLVEIQVSGAMNAVNICCKERVPLACLGCSYGMPR